MATLAFRNYNGILQLRLETPEDLDFIHELEEARWQATSAPIDQFYCDPRFLQYLDEDADGRVRVDELKAAHKWLVTQLKDRSAIAGQTDVLDIGHLDPASAEVAGMKLLAERIIRERGDEGSTQVTLSEVREFRIAYAKKFPNGDGIVTPAQVPAALAPVASHVVASTEGAADVGGERGFRAADIDAFVTLVKVREAWEKEGQSEAVLPLGGDTSNAAELVESLAPKLEQFFALCDFLAAEPGAQARLTPAPEVLQAIDVSNPAAIRDWLSTAPVTRPNVDGIVDLDAPLNPHFASQLRKLSALVEKPLELSRRWTREDWAKVQGCVGAFIAWRNKEPKGLPAGVPLTVLLEEAAGTGPAELHALVVHDQNASQELAQITALEKLVLFQRWLLTFANNFVSFPNLFSPQERSLIESGTLVLDGRTISLCVPVKDRAAHKKGAESSQMFVVYVELTRKDGSATKTQEIAAAVTSGTRGGIEIGKRGVFYDRDKVEWDARILDLIVAPISLWEAAVAPFVRLKDFVADKLQKLAGDKLGELEKKATTSVDSGTLPPPPPPKTEPGAGTGGMGGLLMGGGIAFAALGSTMAFIVKTLSEIEVMNALVAVVSLVLAIGAVSGFLGWLKLRKRDLATMLEAGGWAMNRRMYLTRRLSLIFTQEPELPEGAITERAKIQSEYILAFERRQRAQRNRTLLVLLLVVLLFAVYFGRAEIMGLIGSKP